MSEGDKPEGKQNSLLPSSVSSRPKSVKFERHASQIIYNPASDSFVVTWSKCGIPDQERLAAHKDPSRWLPSVCAIATLYDRGKVEESQISAAIRSIGNSWRMGDRDSLDSEGCKKAAEFISDMSAMSNLGTKDMSLAIRHLLDEIAEVEFFDEPMERFSEGFVLRALSRATEECLATDGFLSWPPASKRRRFLYCLSKRERTKVTYTLVALLFENGACPLLPLSDMRTLRALSMEKSGLGESVTADTISAFLSFALSRMKAAKERGESRIMDRLTQQQLANSVSSNSYSCA